MSYAIFRSEPIYTLTDLAQIGSHNKREKKAYQSNPDIDITKTKDNIEIVPLAEKYIKGFYNITKEYKKEHEERMKTMREDRRKTYNQMLNTSNSVVADELLFTSDNEFFKGMSKKQIKKWADTCMRFVYNDLGYTKDQILHATIHMDEKTPHLHCVVVPLVKKYDKRSNKEKWTISKKQYIKSKAHLSELQGKYYERLINNKFDLERGIKNSDNEHLTVKELKKITRKLDKRIEQQNYLMNRDYEKLEEKLKTSKPTISGKEVKIDKDTYETLNQFMNTSKRVIKDMPQNQALFNELDYHLKNYREVENEKQNIRRELYRVMNKNEELQQENKRLRNFIHNVFQVMKNFFRKILKIGNDKEKDEVVNEVKGAYEMEIYDNQDLHDIADNTSKEKEIDDYLYDKFYSKDDLKI